MQSSTREFMSAELTIAMGYMELGAETNQKNYPDKSKIYNEAAEHIKSLKQNI